MHALDPMRMFALLNNVANTQVDLAKCDADMGRGAFDEDHVPPTQSARDWYAEKADDAIAAVLAWREEIRDAADRTTENPRV